MNPVLRPAICPSILSFDLTSLSTSVPQMEAGGAALVHLDVMDGRFVPPISFGDALARSLRPHTALPFEAHLMIVEPERQFAAFADAGCFRIIFHLEAALHAHRLVDEIHRLGLEAGVAINPATPVSALEELLPDLDLALIMTIDPGWGGQKLLPRTLEKVRRVRELRPELPIQVDGGIDPTTIRPVWEAGATHFVVGSYLLRASDVATGIREVTEACR